MSLRREQYFSLKLGRALLADLLDPRATPRVPRPVRDRASRALKHFPALDDNGKPIFSRDQFGPDEAPQ